MNKILYLKPEEVEIGTEFGGFQYDKGSEWFSGIITKIDDNFVYYDQWGRDPKQKERTPDLRIMVDAPDEWYTNTYKDNIDWLSNHFTETELHGLPKEMYNAWLDYNPYKMTSMAKDKGITILGICLNPPYIKEYADMAIVFEYNDSFEKSWVHIGKEGLKWSLERLGLWDKYKW